MAAVHATLMAAWLLACGRALRLATTRGRGPTLIRAVTAAGGSLLIALGVRTLAQVRT